MTYQIRLANLPSSIYQKYFVWFIPQKSLYVRCKFPKKHSILTFYTNVRKIKHIQNF
ncbi:unknown [Bacteroides sp. CAG:545]|nr:unknown [Bacteroides sp. CAG:545]